MAVDAKYRYGETEEVHIDAPSAQDPGEVIIRGTTIAICQALAGLASGDKGAFATAGVWEMTALTGATWADGAVLNWDDTGKDVQVAAGDAVAGRAVGAKGAGPVVALVQINR